MYMYNICTCTLYLCMECAVPLCVSVVCTRIIVYIYSLTAGTCLPLYSPVDIAIGC